MFYIHEVLSCVIPKKQKERVRSRATKNTALKLHVVEDSSFLKNDAVPMGKQLLMFWRSLLP